MSKSSFIIGLAVAIVLHGLLFIPQNSPDATMHKEDPASGPGQGRVAVLPAPPPSSDEASPEVDLVQDRATPTPDIPDLPPLAEIAKALEVQTETVGVTNADDIPDDALPSMRIIWRDPDELRDVARALGLRVVAVARSMEIVGEVSLQGEPSIEPFSGNLADFSNRVRTIPINYFGSQLARSTTQSVTELWILVPATLDVEFSRIQRDAIAREGIEPAQIRSMEASFTTSRSGQPELSVTRIIPSNTRSSRNG